MKKTHIIFTILNIMALVFIGSAIDKLTYGAIKIMLLIGLFFFILAQMTAQIIVIDKLLKIEDGNKADKK